MKQADARMWRRHALVVVAVILLPAWGAHPERFSLGIMIDAFGVDGLRRLLEIQPTGVLLPILLALLIRYRPYLRPVGRAIGDFLMGCGGPVGSTAGCSWSRAPVRVWRR